MPKPRIGTIHKLPSGKWLARYSAPNGSRYGKSFLTKGDGTKWLQIVYADISSGRWVSPNAASTALLFRDYSESWLKSRMVKGRPIAERTRSGYRDLLDRFILDSFGGRPLHEISRDEVKRWYARTATKTPTYRTRAYSLLRGILNTAVEDEYITENPARIKGAGTVERRHQVRILDDDELDAMTEAIPPRYRALIQLAYWTGLRYGELTELRRHDIDMKRGTIAVRRAVVLVDGRFVVKTPKSGAGIRDVDLTPDVLPYLRAHLLEHAAPGTDGLLFPAAHNPEAHLRQSAFARVFYPAREAVGREDFRFHDFRHTHLTRYAQTGATMADTMARAGHSTSTAAQRYQHAAESRQAELTAALSAQAAARRLAKDAAAAAAAGS